VGRLQNLSLRTRAYTPKSPKSAKTYHASAKKRRIDLIV
jgi:hypothetical protein